MAGIWEIKIEVVDLPAKRYRVTGTRTDGEDVRTYSCAGHVDTDDLAGTKDKILASLQAQYTEAVEKQAAVDALLEDWQGNLEAAMNAWETG